MSDWVKGIYIKEMPNRFRCEVEVGGKIHMCYQPLSFKLTNLMNPVGKKFYYQLLETMGNTSNFAG